MNSILIVLVIVIVVACAPPHPALDVIIRNPSSKLVLEDKNNVVTVESLHGRDSQIWNLIDTGTGTFYIQNKATGKVIQQEKRGVGVVTDTQSDEEKEQQWHINFNAIIENADSGLILLAELDDFIPGKRVIVQKYKHPMSEVFRIEKP